LQYIILWTIVRGMITPTIRAVAERRGIENANQLSKALAVSPDLSARLWREDFQRIDLATMDKLCRVLRCKPNDLLKYEPD
jgi:DNA-binding Xre family transcriptional regulator